jgi:hypothetical protein
VKDATTDEQPGDKKVKKRKREMAKQNAAPAEPAASPADDGTKDVKKSKKRKHKEKREEEGAAKPESSATNDGERKRKKKRKSGSIE